MGYLNKTCNAGTISPTYGPTVGPVLRGAESKRWAEWAFTGVGQSPEGLDLVTIKTFYPGGGEPL
jgi:hypothetical protein